MWRIIAVLAIVALSAPGSADLIDLKDYIIDTGDVDVDLDFTLPHRNETTGEYFGMAGFGEGSMGVLISLWEGENATKYDQDNLTANGYKPVKKPYPGYLKTNSTTGEVNYLGTAGKNLNLQVICQSSQAALDLLNQIKVISRQDYEAIKSRQLEASLA